MSSVAVMNRFYGRWICRVAELLVMMLLVAGSAIVQAQSGSQPNLKIAGTVRDSKGLPVGGASVRIESSAGSKLQEMSTTSNGTFELGLPNAGAYVLRIQESGYAEFVEPVQIAETQHARFDIVLSRPAEQASTAKSASEMQFSDNPDFTVAGVTDWTAAGGHGSDVNLRTSETLAKQTRALQSSGAATGVADKSFEDLRQEREHLPGRGIAGCRRQT